jgi:hypothetical protein
MEQADSDFSDEVCSTHARGYWQEGLKIDDYVAKTRACPARERKGVIQ